MATRSTHTEAMLEVNPETWRDIFDRLKAAGYVFKHGGGPILMTGLQIGASKEEMAPFAAAPLERGA